MNRINGEVTSPRACACRTMRGFHSNLENRGNQDEDFHLSTRGDVFRVVRDQTKSSVKCDDNNKASRTNVNKQTHYRCREWAERCNILHIFEKFGPVKFNRSARICSDHFDRRYIRFDGKKKKLMKNAMPRLVTSANVLGTYSDDSLTSKLFQNLCRLCAEEHTDLTSIYGSKGKTLDLEEKLKMFPIVVEKRDKLPLKICSRCIVKISNFYEFVKNCLKADARLKTILSFGEYDMPGTKKVRKRSGCNQCKDDLEDNSMECIVSVNNNPSTNCGIINDGVRVPVEFEEPMGIQPVEVSIPSRANTGEDSLLIKFPQTVESMGTRYPCKVCFKTFLTQDILESHAKAHSLMPDEFGRYICEKCGKIFKNKYSLNEHNRLHTGECPYFCSHCGKKFRKRSLLKQHSVVHEATKRFICSICNMRCNRKGNLIQHLRTHAKNSEGMEKGGGKNNNRIEMYHCSTCGIVYPTCEDLKNHRKSEHPNEKTDPMDMENILMTEGLKNDQNDVPVSIYTCGLCQQQCSVLKTLKNHFKIHLISGNWESFGCVKESNTTGETTPSKPQIKPNIPPRSNITLVNILKSGRIFECDECGMRFKRKDTLTNHIRIHTGERPFVCKYCGFAFKQKGDCNKHERNHAKVNGEELFGNK